MTSSDEEAKVRWMLRGTDPGTGRRGTLVICERELLDRTARIYWQDGAIEIAPCNEILWQTSDGQESEIPPAAYLDIKSKDLGGLVRVRLCDRVFSIHGRLPVTANHHVITHVAIPARFKVDA